MSTRTRSRSAVLGLTVGALATGGLAVAPAAAAAPGDARITEIHYDNDGTDAGEAIEVTAPSDADLVGLRVVLYNGSDGATYDTRTITAAEVVASGIAVLQYPSNGIQNGSPDGVALVDPAGGIVQFLSYEGELTAAGGPAAGQESTDIGVVETGSTPAGRSLQADPATGEWYGPAAATFGTTNPGPGTGGGDDGGDDGGGDGETPADTDARVTELHYDNDGADTGEAVEVTASTPGGLTGLSVVLYNGNGGTVYATGPVAAGTDGVAVVSPSSIQNGDPDGLALVTSQGEVLEFLSYEGRLTATEGPAAGQESTDIGVAETSSTPAGQSLQLDPATGGWYGPEAETFGAVNPGPGTGGGDDGGDGEPPACDVETTPIGEVQGSTDTSPVEGQTVTVGGTVVGDLQEGGFDGVFVQDGGDGDSATSDGIFVYGTGSIELQAGDQVVVRGTVTEYPSDADTLSLTELTDPAIGVCGEGTLPEPVTLPMPSTDAQREALEGMLVAPAEQLTVTEVYDLNRYGQVMLASGGRLLAPTEAAEPGPASAEVAEENAQRSLLLDDGTTANLSTAGIAPPYLEIDDPVRVGDTAVLQPVVLSYGFGDWLLEPVDGTPEGTTFEATNPRPEAPPAVGGDLTIADFNVLNYFVTFGGDARGAENAEELAEQEAKIVTALAELDADVLTLHEIENSAVTTPDTPYRAVETLIAALEAADGNDWDHVRAHEDSDVITNAIIYRTDRVTPVGEATTPSGEAYAAAFDNARAPIAQTFDADGEVFSVITNHLKSKGSSCGAASDDTSVGGAGNCDGDRVAQAQILVEFAEEVARQAGDPDVLLTGDFNAYRYEDPIDVLTAAGYTDVGPLRAPDQHSYVFGGGSGSLDHVLASPSMLEKLTGMGVWDINAVESYAYQYDGYEPLYAPYEYRASDHNPAVVGLATEPAAVPAEATISDETPYRGDRVTVTGTGFGPGERVTATLASGARLGSATADDEGTVRITFRVPVVLPAGSQQVVLTGSSGENATTGFEVRSVLQELVSRLLGWFGRW